MASKKMSFADKIRKPSGIGTASSNPKLNLISDETKEELKANLARAEAKKSAQKNPVDISEYLPDNYVMRQVPVEGLADAPSEWNFFSRPTKNRILALSESIYYNGLLQPIIVRETDKKGSLQILAGHTRVLAFRTLKDVLGDEKYATIPAIVFPYGSLDDKKAEDIVCDTNFMQRGTLSTMETARCIQLKAKRIKENGLKRGEGSVASKISEYYHIKRAMVFRWQRMANLIPELAQVVSDRGINAANAYKLASLPPEKQQDLFKRCASQMTNETLRHLNVKDSVSAMARSIRDYKAPGTNLIQFRVNKEYLRKKEPLLVLMDEKKADEIYLAISKMDGVFTIQSR